MSVKFIDLFAGIGGFHAVGEHFGWKCVFASEWDERAAEVYYRNWGIKPAGDIREFTRRAKKVQIPDHDVLFAGFPCQPFSKSGRQLGMQEDRGSLFHDILLILKSKKPSVIVLENVRNITGPRHEHEWKFIVSSLQKIGYNVSHQPFVVSPHRIPPSFGGAPQARERVFIVGSLSKEVGMKEEFVDFAPPVLPTDFDRWNPNSWELIKDLALNPGSKKTQMRYRLSNDEIQILDAWDDFLIRLLDDRQGLRLPGFPLWSDLWGSKPTYKREKSAPDWKVSFEEKNIQFYKEHKKVIDSWFKSNPSIRNAPPSKRKLEWQAQDMRSIWDGLIHFRPSGIRVKRATYVPALVAITQTSIIGPFKRRITPQEAALLQGLPIDFDFGFQSDSEIYKQLGNGVSVGAATQVVHALVNRDSKILKNINGKILRSVKSREINQNPRKISEVKTEMNLA